MKIARDGTMTVITLTPMERLGLLQLVTHTAPSDVVQAAEEVGEEVNAAAVKVVTHGIYMGLREQETVSRGGPGAGAMERGRDTSDEAAS